MGGRESNGSEKVSLYRQVGLAHIDKKSSSRLKRSRIEGGEDLRIQLTRQKELRAPAVD